MLNGCHYPIHIMDSDVVYSRRRRDFCVNEDWIGQVRALRNGKRGRQILSLFNLMSEWFQWEMSPLCLNSNLIIIGWCWRGELPSVFAEMFLVVLIYQWQVLVLGLAHWFSWWSYFLPFLRIIFIKIYGIFFRSLSVAQWQWCFNQLRTTSQRVSFSV